MNASNGNKRIHLDYAASTPVDSRVVEAMESYWNVNFSNPSALYEEARQVRKVVELSRKTVAGAFRCTPQEVLFTAGGTEANNIAIFGTVGRCNLSNVHCVTSRIEHSSVSKCFKALEKEGAQVEYVGVDKEGILDMSAFERSLSEHTKLVSIMFANNEIGTVQPIRKIARVMQKKCPSALLHTDASQAPVFYKLDVASLDVDLLTIDAQKMYGPKGVGALYKRSGVTLTPVLYGGGHEQGLRPGTENVPSIVGLARAYEIAEQQRDDDVGRMTELRDYFIERLEELFSTSVINGSKTERLPNNINVSFENVEGEFLVVQLDAAGIACAARSACFGSGGEGSRVVAEIDPARARGAIRFSLGRETTKHDIDHTLLVLEEKVKA